MQRMSIYVTRRHYGSVASRLSSVNPPLYLPRLNTTNKSWNSQVNFHIYRSLYRHQYNAASEKGLPREHTELQGINKEDIDGLEGFGLDEFEGLEDLDGKKSGSRGETNKDNLEGLEGLSVEDIEGLSEDDLAELEDLMEFDATEKTELTINMSKHGHLEDAESQELRERIAQLEDELNELRTGKSLSLLSPEDRNKMKSVFAKTVSDGAGRHVQIKGTSDMVPENLNGNLLRRASHEDLDTMSNLPPEHDINHQRLKKALAEAAIDLSNTVTVQQLWRSYVLCRQNIPSFFQHIPEGAWDVLWESQYRARGLGTDTEVHLRSLLDDMLYCKRELTPAQKLVFLESHLLEGHYLEAMHVWQREQSSLRGNKDTAIYFEDLGVRIFSSAGQPQRAQDLAFEVLRHRESPRIGRVVNNRRLEVHNQQSRARILTPVIEAWAKKADDISIKHAWAIYLRFKMLLKSDIMLEDYDAITTCFLDAGRINLALAVFKDLMLTGQSSGYDSTELYRASLGLINTMTLQCIDMEELMKVSLTALTLLPKRFENKFFYASWMKRLLGMGKIDAAISVLELMLERGVNADPKHLNGIIAALLRTGNAKEKEKGVQLGWAMIQERLEVVKRRQLHNGTDQCNEASTTDRIIIHRPPHLPRIYVPSATIETFSLLLLYFERRGMLGSVHRLRDSLNAAGIPLNAYFMNHLIYAELRQGKYREAWMMYSRMKNIIRLDLETFAALWDCEKAHLDRSAVRRTEPFPDPRHIFSDMMEWLSKRSTKERSLIQEEFSRELYMQVIRCFCLAKDVEGTLVAMYALKDAFQLYPDEDTARMVALQVSRLGENEAKVIKRRRQRNQVKDDDVVNVKRVAQMLRILAADREKVLHAGNITREAMSEKELAEESLHRLTELLRTVLRGSGMSDVEMEERIEKSSWEMGTGGLRMGNPILAAKHD